jgi:uncharacterized membrane protein
MECAVKAKDRECWRLVTAIFQCGDGTPRLIGLRKTVKNGHQRNISYIPVTQIKMFRIYKNISETLNRFSTSPTNIMKSIA